MKESDVGPRRQLSLLGEQKTHPHSQALTVVACEAPRVSCSSRSRVLKPSSTITKSASLRRPAMPRRSRWAGWSCRCLRCLRKYATHFWRRVRGPLRGWRQLHPSPPQARAPTPVTPCPQHKPGELRFTGMSEGGGRSGILDWDKALSA